MTKLLDRTNLFFEHLPDRMRRYRWPVWLLFILVTVFLAFGIARLTIDMGLEVYFQKDEPVKQAYDRFRALFGGDEAVYIVYEARDGDIFSDDSLRTLQKVQNDLLDYRMRLKPGEVSALDHIADVKTLLNVQYMEAREDTLISRDFIGRRLPENDAEREQLRRQALSHPDYPNLYLSEDSRFGGIVIQTDFNAVLVEGESGSAESALWDIEEDDAFDDESEAFKTAAEDLKNEQVVFKKVEMMEYGPFAVALERILENPEYTDVLEFHAVGTPILMSWAIEVTEREMKKIIFGALLLIIITLWILFRSFSAVIWPLLTVAISLVWVLGLIGWLGVTVTSMVSIIVFLILAVGVAVSVHILSGYLFFRNQNQDHRTALRSVFRKSALACLLASLTTSIGLLSLLFVPIVPIKTFGAFAALGVFFTFFITAFILPLMLDLWNPFSKKRSEKVLRSGERIHFIQFFLKKVEGLGYRYSVHFVIGFTLVGLILVAGIFRIQVNSDVIEQFKEGVPIRDTYELVNKYMGGTDNLEVLIDLGKTDGLKDPRVLKAIDGLQNFIEEKYVDIVTSTVSLVNVTKDSYKTLNQGRADMYIVPDDPRMLEQTLFLFNSANPKDRRRLVSDDYQKGRVSVSLKSIGSKTGVQLIDDVHSYADKNFAPLKEDYPGLDVTTTGQIPLMLLLLDYISWSQIQSFGLALGVISVLFLVMLGSRKIGIIALFPNIFPVITIFGLMGYLRIPLDHDTLLIAPIIMGIAVDDTIHFMTHYRLEMQEHGIMRQAIVNTIREVGQAITFTSVILSLGFLIFVFSISVGISNFGIFSAIAIFAALMADLLLLPAMLVVFGGRFKKTEYEARIAAEIT
jgi:predicted RND superfamily exporter protein